MYKLFKGTNSAVGFTNVILLRSDRRDVSATRVASFRVVTLYCLTFRRLMSTIVDVPHHQPLSVAFYVFIQQI